MQNHFYFLFFIFVHSSFWILCIAVYLINRDGLEITEDEMRVDPGSETQL
jgi:hypothetical protein